MLLAMFSIKIVENYLYFTNKQDTVILAELINEDKLEVISYARNSK
jgi:hypothetical protein